jgi:hypothetical protein
MQMTLNAGPSGAGISYASLFLLFSATMLHITRLQCTLFLFHSMRKKGYNQ